jgi:hypothetical protein
MRNYSTSAGTSAGYSAITMYGLTVIHITPVLLKQPSFIKASACCKHCLKMPLQFLTSRLGNQQLLFDGFRYVLERARNGKRNWKCSKYDKGLCRGRCQSMNDTATLTADHNHSPSNNEDGTVSNPQQYGASVFSQKHNFGATPQPAPKHFSDELPRQSYTADLSDEPYTTNPSHHGSIDSYTDSAEFEDYKSILEANERKFLPARFTGLRKRMWEVRQYLVLLITPEPRHREIILRAGGSEMIQSLAAFCNAILDSRISISPDEKSSLMEHRTIIRKIADRTVKMPTKIRILQRNPLFLIPIIPIIDKFLLGS